MANDFQTARKALGLTQSELAEKLGLHQSTVSRFETEAMPLDERTKLALRALVFEHQAREQAA
jgi:transcriptional regulator with XRE-family HTH domain